MFWCTSLSLNQSSHQLTLNKPNLTYHAQVFDLSSEASGALAYSMPQKGDRFGQWATRLIWLFINFWSQIDQSLSSEIQVHFKINNLSVAPTSKEAGDPEMEFFAGGHLFSSNTISHALARVVNH